MKKAYFGDESSVVGKYIEADNVKYRVCGVVKNVPITSYMTYSDIYLPYTVSKTDSNDRAYRGRYMGILLANSKSDLTKMHDEYERMVQKLPMEGKEFNRIFSHADTYITSYVDTGNEQQSGVLIVLTVMQSVCFYLNH